MWSGRKNCQVIGLLGILRVTVFVQAAEAMAFSMTLSSGCTEQLVCVSSNLDFPYRLANRKYAVDYTISHVDEILPKLMHIVWTFSAQKFPCGTESIHSLSNYFAD